MYYYPLYLRGVKEAFTWQSPEKLKPGARVRVNFRNRGRLGIVLSRSETKPKFKTQPILEVLDRQFVAKTYIDLSQKVAEENFCSVQKVLSLMIPEAFLVKVSPEKREIHYSLVAQGEVSLRGPKQKAVYEHLKAHLKVKEKDLLGIGSRAILKNLLDKKIIQCKEGALVDPFKDTRSQRPTFDFTPLQQKVFEQIKKSSKPSLLFGVTGSGKTEIYKKIALEIIAADPTAQVLFLLPEIALSPQLIAEFYGVFEGRVAVWHSKLSEGEKIQEYARMNSGEAQVLVGARSAVFVPLRNPKLIILDEEHEWTFKNEFAPRFWTHDVVEGLARLSEAKLIFGSATPRLESVFRCKNEEWEMVEMKKRVFETKLPKIEMVDLKNEAKKGDYGPLSQSLQKAIQETLNQKKQAVLFLNKRGFAGATLCKSCGHSFECPDCTSNMKMHQKQVHQTLLCHICGRLEKFPEKCPQCGTKDFQFKGWGTQQVESVLKETFPSIRVFRADADSITRKHDFERLMDRFHNYEADILLGTQMVAKGLDFERVEMVGVILADVGLSLPDFRSEERVFQLLTQVSGRAGRRENQGKIIIQSFQPKSSLFQYLRKHDTDQFIADQLELRKAVGHPPYGHMAKITFAHPQKERAFGAAKQYFQYLISLEEIKGRIECHLAPAFFPKVYGKFHFHVFLKSPKKESLIQCLKKHPTQGKIDINPSSLL